MSEQSSSRLALVTGGTGGIGNAICRRLLAAGYRVVTNYRNQEKAERWQQKLRDEGHEVGIYVCDVGDNEQCAEVMARIEAEHGGVDVLVNNAGITRDTTMRKMSYEQWQAVLRINLDGVFNVTRPLLGGMLERGWGRIINISSINGQKGQIGQTNYAAAKAGMHGFTKSLALEVARKGITVNTVSPGYIATEMVMAVREDIRQQIVAQIPVGRLGQPEEIAAAVAYLASDEAGFVTGSNLSINGGQHMC
jgi:acetoacetyl-CoA reductase